MVIKEPVMVRPLASPSSRKWSLGWKKNEPSFVKEESSIPFIGDFEVLWHVPCAITHWDDAGVSPLPLTTTFNLFY